MFDVLNQFNKATDAEIARLAAEKKRKEEAFLASKESTTKNIKTIEPNEEQKKATKKWEDFVRNGGYEARKNTNNRKQEKNKSEEVQEKNKKDQIVSMEEGGLEVDTEITKIDKGIVATKAQIEEINKNVQKHKGTKVLNPSDPNMPTYHINETTGVEGSKKYNRDEEVARLEKKIQDLEKQKATFLKPKEIVAQVSAVENPVVLVTAPKGEDVLNGDATNSAVENETPKVTVVDPALIESIKNETEENRKFYEEQGARIFAEGKSGEDQTNWEAQNRSEGAVDGTEVIGQPVVGAEDIPSPEVPKEEIKYTKELWKGMDAEEKERDLAEEKMRNELAELRKSFVKTDFETTSTLDRIKGIFGKWIKTEPGNVAEMSAVSEEYKTKKIELLQFKIQELRDSGLSEEALREKMGALATEFTIEENRLLFAERTNLKLAKLNGVFGEKAVKWTGDAVNWYRKLPSKYKFMIAGVFFAAGMAGFASGGGMVAGGIMTANFARKFLSSAATGAGTTAMFEGMYRAEEGVKAGSKHEEMMKQFDLGADLDQKIKNLMDQLSEKMDQSHQDLRTEANRARGRKVVGTMAGMGAMVISNWNSLFGNHAVDVPTSDESVIKGEITRDMTKVFSSEHAGGAAVAGKAAVEHGKEAVGVVKNLAKEKIAEWTGKYLEVKQGSSLEGALIENLKGSGLNPTEAGKQAHLMAMKYAETHGFADKGPYSLIHKGARLMMSDDGKRLLGIDGDKHLGWLKPDGGFELEKNLSRAGLKNIVDGIKEKFGAEIPIGKTIPDLNNFSELKIPSKELFKKAIDGIVGSQAVSGVAQKAAEMGNEFVEGAKDLATGHMTEKGKKALEKVAYGVAGAYAIKKTREGLKTKEEKKKTDGEAFKKAAEEAIAKKATEKAAEEDAKKKASDAKSKEAKAEEKIVPDTFVSRGKDTIRYVSFDAQDSWKAMKGMTLNTIGNNKDGMGAKINVNIKKTEEVYGKIIGKKEAKPRNGETLSKWLARIIDESLKDKYKSKGKIDFSK